MSDQAFPLKQQCAHMDQSEELLKLLFSDEPAKLGERYIESVINDIRYSVSSRSRFVARPATIPVNAPSWLRNDQVLGPYEKTILSDILSVENSIIAYRGGSGSGKSSIANALSKRAQILCNATNSPLGGSWAEATGLSTFFLKCDFQEASKFSFDQARLHKFSNELLGEFYLWIRDLLLKNFIEQTSTQKATEETFRYFIHDEENHHHYIEEFKSKLEDEISTMPTWRTSSIRDAWLRASTDIEPQHALSIAIALFSSAARMMREKTNETDNLIICLDNTDRVRPDLLNIFMVHVESIFTQSEYRDSGLKLLFFVRLSTSNDIMGALPAVPMREIASPDPEDIILPIILGFLYNQNSAVNSFDTRTVFEVKTRLLELLIRLNDPFDKLSDLLVSISGTNIRTYYKQLVNLLTEPSFKPRFRDELELQSFLPNISEFVADMTLFRMVLKVSVAVNQSLAGQQRIDGNTVLQLSETASISACESLIGLLSAQEAARFSIRGEVYAVAEVAHILKNRLANETRRKSIFDGKIFDDLLKGALEETIRLVHAIEFEGYSKNFLVRSYVVNFVKVSEQYFEDRASIGGYEVDDILSFVRSIGSIYMEMSRKDQVRSTLIWGRSRLSQLMPKISDTRIRHFPPARQSRYSVTRILLGTNDTSPSHVARPINIFSIDDYNYQPITLKILYDLGCASTLMDFDESARTITKKNLIACIHNQGYKIDDIVSAIRSISKQDNRLVYSTNMNNEEMQKGNFEEIDEGSPIYLSWCGRRYYSLLTSNFHYIQWSLFQMNALIREVASDRVEIAGVGILDVIPEYGVVESISRNELGAWMTLNAFWILLDFVSERRRRNPYEIHFPDIETEVGREIVFTHRYPEVDILMKTAPDLFGVLRYLSKERFWSSREIESLMRKVNNRCDDICTWAHEEFGVRVVSWDESLALTVDH